MEQSRPGCGGQVAICRGYCGAPATPPTLKEAASLWSNSAPETGCPAQLFKPNLADDVRFKKFSFASYSFMVPLLRAHISAVN